MTQKPDYQALYDHAMNQRFDLALKYSAATVDLNRATFALKCIAGWIPYSSPLDPAAFANAALSSLGLSPSYQPKLIDNLPPDP